MTFLISPESFRLPEETNSQLEKYGHSIAAFYKACEAIFQSLPHDHKWKVILNKNKPDWLIKKASSAPSDTYHVFLRPDFILTDNGVTTTEIETSPFGLALALFLNNNYPDAHHYKLQIIDLLIEEVLNGDKKKKVCFLLTNHTKKYYGQFEYITKILHENGIDAIVAMPEDITEEQGTFTTEAGKIDILYRGFYLHEATQDTRLANILQSELPIYPGCKYHLEEKALMAMLHDTELEPLFRDHLGEYFDILKKIIPSTYILEKSPPPHLNIQDWRDLSKISRRKRNYILKISGFSKLGSWAKGVIFLNQLSQEECKQVIEDALASPSIFVIQEFHQGKKFSQEYYDFESKTIRTMIGRVRLTPYYHRRTGSLISAKTTMCPNTDFIHASTQSINTPIK